MKHLMISYDLLRPGKDYKTLLDRLRKLGAVEILISQWLLVTHNTPKEIRDDLRGCVDSNDRILVVELTGTAAWTSLMIPDDSFKQALRA